MPLIHNSSVFSWASSIDQKTNPKILMFVSNSEAQIKKIQKRPITFFFFSTKHYGYQSTITFSKEGKTHRKIAVFCS